MPKILISPAPLDGVDAAFKQLLLDAGFELVYPRIGRQLVENELHRFLEGCEAALAGSEPYTRAVLEKHPQLRVVARVGVGYDAVDVRAATEHGIVVTIAPGTNEESVAEHTMMLLLACARNLISQHNQIVAGRWPRNANVPIRRQTLGLIGLGRIGRAVALRGLAFGMRVLAHEPNPIQSFVDKHGIILASLDEVIRQADFLSLHAPLLPETRYLINEQTLEWMKPTAYLINTSRGGLVNEKDLVEALQQRRIAGAGLDVFEEEPPPADHPLFKFENVILTAHTAGVDWRSRDDMALSAAQAVVDLYHGRWPAEKIVNPEVRARFRWV
jgi:phosphoglycerate dehydrogenase-like enzyme